jgi:hypothetical protein
VQTVRQAGYEVYDFRHPTPGNDGFHWRNTVPGFNPEETDVDSFNQVLEHPVARRGAALDIAALVGCDACLMVLPCGNSSHLELGYVAGAGKPAVIWAPVRFKADLMYALAHYMTETLAEAIWYLDKTLVLNKR